LILRIIFLLLITHNVIGQTNSEKFENYQNSHHLEKVYINHDKPFYLLGDTIWCQAVFVDGKTHQFFNASPIVYVDLINDEGKIVDNYLLKIDQGLASFQIPTKYDDDPGEYILRGYTQYQRNFENEYMFQKNVMIFSDSMATEVLATNKNSGKFDAKFYPEGGEIVNGLNTKVAVKVQNPDGDNLSYTGVLVDDDNTEIKTFKSYNEGIGFFEFIPEQGKTYKARVTYDGVDKSFELPKPLKEGYTINLNSRAKEYIILTLESNKKDLLQGASLVGHVRGQLFIDQPLNAEAKQQLKIQRDQIPSGILHFTLFDEKGRPVCQRLTFNKNPSEKVDVSVNLSKAFYGQREKTELVINTSQAEKTIPSSFSVSVYNKDVIPTGDSDPSIVNYLLLQSDLKGRIDNINQYFLIYLCSHMDGVDLLGKIS